MDTWHAKPTASPDAQLAELVYELLDAHDDTARLAREQLGVARWAGEAVELRWAAHLDYLRSLQRVARAALARAAPATGVVRTAPAAGSSDRDPRGP